MFFITVVIYRKNIEDIASLESITGLVRDKRDVRVIVVDNSEPGRVVKTKASFADFFSADEGKYIAMGENVGLPKAYNTAIKYAMKNGSPDDFMLFVDDDTIISREYLEHIYAEAGNEERKSDGINVICGRIESDGRPLSPVYKYRFRFKDKDYITEPGIYDNAACINSAMAVRVGALRKAHGFDERLFLDMTDFMLMYRLTRRKLNKMLVMDDVIRQDFSGRDNTDRESTLARFEIYKNDFTTFCEVTGRGELYAKLGILKRRIAIQKKTKWKKI